MAGGAGPWPAAGNTARVWVLGPRAAVRAAGPTRSSVFHLSRFLMNLRCHLISQTEMSGYRNNLWSSPRVSKTFPC